MGGLSCKLGSNYLVIIAEKPKAGEKIARALGTPRKCINDKIPYWVLSIDNRSVVVVSSAGHLFEPYSHTYGFPVFEFTWKPIWETDPRASYLRKFYEVLKLVVPRASKYISACDYDIEGSVICYKIIEALGDPRKAMRMKFSTLTSYEIREAFRKLQPLDVEMVEAGLARHELDWLWGINISRALMHAVNIYGGRRVTLSAGRVQSPTLVEAVRRWEELNLHSPKPSISMSITVKTREGLRFKVYPLGWSPRDMSEANSIEKDLKASGGLIITVYDVIEDHINPPPPFNLGDLQHEAARVYGFSPMRTQKIAEDLYLAALISYPRTNSQKLPPTIDYAMILKGIGGIREYSSLVKSLLEEVKGVLRPVQGRADDPAHPAIYPTGEKPKNLSRDQMTIYDMIVRRFMASFAGKAVIARIRIVLVDSRGRNYEARGLKVVKEGWMKYYYFLKPQETPIPKLVRGESVQIDNIKTRIIWSKPMIEISKDSLLKWMESVHIGTESTRARIIETLYKRGYIVEDRGYSRVTDLGYSVSQIIIELFPKLSSPELTRDFERKLEDIRYGRRKREEVRKEAITTLDHLLKIYTKRLEEAGHRLAIALNLKSPRNPCEICGREATSSLNGLKLCEHHFKALERLGESLKAIVSTLGVSRLEAIKIIASKKRSTGIWVLEVARKALEDSRFTDLIERLSNSNFMEQTS